MLYKSWAFVVPLLQVSQFTPDQPEKCSMAFSAGVVNLPLYAIFISPPLWLRGEVSTKPLARPNSWSWFSQPERLRVDAARQTLALEAFHIRLEALLLKP
jgi:hypothetical protein